MSRFSFAAKCGLTAAAIAVASTQFAANANACGGCVSPPVVGTLDKQQVLQNAERVLFVHDPVTKKSTVWIEVRYSGLAKDFGWILPVPKLPVIGVGSKSVFDALDQRLQFRFNVVAAPDENCRDAYEGCEQNQSDKLATPTSGGNFGSADAGASAQDTSKSESGVVILAQGSTGPYNYVVVKGSEAKALYDWLTQNGYVLPEKGKPILQSHIDKGDVFVAIKLQNGQGIEAIRPVTLTMDNAEPCVPLRLTSIAAAEEMAVTVTIAGPGRAVVKNHMDVQLNPLRLAFDGSRVSCPTGAAGQCTIPTNYGQLLSAAIDEAGGHAFVTEASIASSGLGQLSPLTSGDLTQLKQAKNWLDFANFLRNTSIPLDSVADLMADAIAKSALFDDKTSAFAALAALKGCAGFWGMGQQLCDAGAFKLKETDVQNASFDGVLAADLLQKGIIDPVFDVAKQLGASARVTRLNLRISPNEMDRDPVFAFSDTLPEVQPFRTVETNVVCKDGWSSGPKQTRISHAGLGTWVVDTTSIIDPVFIPTPAAFAVFVQEEHGAAVQIAKADIGTVDLAIAGALPGKVSVPANLTLQTPAPWQAPASTPVRTGLGVWTQPQFCTAKSGWATGKLPPVLTPSSSSCTAGRSGQFAGFAGLFLVCALLLRRRLG